MIGEKRSGLNRPRVTVKVVLPYQPESAVRRAEALPGLLQPGDGPSTLTFHSGCKQVAYEVWNAVRRKKPAPRVEAGHVCFCLWTVVVGKANLDNLSALVTPEL